MMIPQIPRYRALYNTMRFVRDPIALINEQLSRLGPSFYTYLGGVYRGLVTTDPEVIQYVLQKNNRNYLKSPMHFERVSHFLGHGLLTSEGDYWLRQRRLIQPGFHRSRLAALTRIMQEVIDEFMDKFDKELARNPTVDTYKYMMELAFSVVARSLFSADLKESELQRMAHLITVLQEFIIRQIRQPYLNWWFKLSGKLRRHEKLASEFDKLIQGIIRERRQSGQHYDDLLQMLLDTRYEDTGEGMTDRQLFEETAILFVAGHETSANALAWTWYLLAQHPEVVQKARQELQEVLGDRAPAFEDLPRLQYLSQIIDESMRVYPPAWITDRIAIEDDECKGIPIPKGIVVVTYFYGTHHSPLLWEDPERFDPDRFSPENAKRQKPYAYLPFGGGPRLCIGNNFATMEMQLTLAAMLRRYDFECVPGQKVEAQALITLRPKNGIRMRFFKRP